MRIALIVVALFVTGCRDKGPEAPSAAENRQLDEAGTMLDDMANEPAPEAEANNAA